MGVMLMRMVLSSLDPNLDGATNSFAFEGTGAVLAADTSYVATACEAFYNTAGTGGTHALCFYLAQSLDRGTNHNFWEAYDITAHLNGTPHGSPIASGQWTLGVSATGANYIPEGNSACISYRGDYGTDVEFAPGARPRARDRARCYLGPINIAATTNASGTNRCILNGQFITDALAAMFSLSESVTGSSTPYNLRVWSRKDAAVKLPTEAFVDDRPDYQRRRSDDTPGTRTYRALASV